MSNRVRRAAVILRNYELNPYYGIVFFDDTVDDGETITPMEGRLDEAIRAHFMEHRDSPDDEFEDTLEGYEYFYIPLGVAEKLAKVEIPTMDIGHLNNSDDAAQIVLEQLMITVCEKFAYTDRFTQGED